MFCMCIWKCICICRHSGIICNWVQCIAITSGRDGGVCLIPALITTGWHAYHALPRQGWQCWVADDFSHLGEIVTILANEQSFGYMTTWRDSDHNITINDATRALKRWHSASKMTVAQMQIYIASSFWFHILALNWWQLLQKNHLEDAIDPSSRFDAWWFITHSLVPFFGQLPATRSTCPRLRWRLHIYLAAKDSSCRRPPPYALIFSPSMWFDAWSFQILFKPLIVQNAALLLYKQWHIIFLNNTHFSQELITLWLWFHLVPIW